MKKVFKRSLVFFVGRFSLPSYKIINRSFFNFMIILYNKLRFFASILSTFFSLFLIFFQQKKLVFLAFSYDLFHFQTYIKVCVVPNFIMEGFK